MPKTTPKCLTPSTSIDEIYNGKGLKWNGSKWVASAIPASHLDIFMEDEIFHHNNYQPVKHAWEEYLILRRLMLGIKA